MYELAHDLTHPDHAVDVFWLVYFPLDLLANTLMVILHMTDTPEGDRSFAVDALRGKAFVSGHGRVVFLLQHTTASGRTHMRPLRVDPHAAPVQPDHLLRWALTLGFPIREVDCVGWELLPPDHVVRRDDRPCTQCRRRLTDIPPPSPSNLAVAQRLLTASA